MSAKNRKAIEPARFEGNGISYRAKLIGVEDVPDARGDKMCQEMIQKLKSGIKVSGLHKQRIFVNVTLEGLRIYDAVAMTLQHTHPVHQISFISRDVTDSRAFGYIYGTGDGTHKFFGIKTANAAENLVLALRDLFQTVYEMKKKEMEEAKAKATAGTQENQQGEGDNIDTTYQVPPNGAPVEGQENIYQGIEQIKNLDFENLTGEEAPRQKAASPTTTTADPTDPWGLSSVNASPTPSSAPSSSLADLHQLNQARAMTSNPFGGMQTFPGTPAPGMGITGLGGPFTVPTAGGMAFMAPGQQAMAPPGGMPVAKDPFGDDPFNSGFAAHPRAPVPQVGMPFGQQPGFGNPFPVAGPFPGQPFPGAVSPRGVPLSQGFGLPGPGFAPFGLASPAVLGMPPRSPQPQQQSADPNILQPLKPGGQQQQVEEALSTKPRGPPLFEDLVDIKKSTDTAKSPKEMFKQLQSPSKKSLNDIKTDAGKPPAAAAVPAKASDLDFDVDPFGSLDAVLDTTSAGADPFDTTTHISPPSSPPPPLPPPSLLPPPPVPPDPSTHPTRKKSESEREQVTDKHEEPAAVCLLGGQKETSPEARFEMPAEPPPPLPPQFSTPAPAPPPRPPPRDRNEPPVPQRPRPRPRRSLSSASASSITSPLSISSQLLPLAPPMPSLSLSTQPPPLPSSPRPSSQSGPSPNTLSAPTACDVTAASVAASSIPSCTADINPLVSAAGNTVNSISDCTHKGANQLRPPDSHDTSTSSSPCVFHPPSSPSHSVDSSLSHASSQKSLNERTLNPTEEDDPFEVPLRSKKLSSSDGTRKLMRSSSSASKSSVVSDSRTVSLNSDLFSKQAFTDPFGAANPFRGTDPFAESKGRPFEAIKSSTLSDSVSSDVDLKSKQTVNSKSDTKQTFTDPFGGVDPFASADPFGASDPFVSAHSKTTASSHSDLNSKAPPTTNAFGVAILNHATSLENSEPKPNCNRSPVTGDAFGGLAGTVDAFGILAVTGDGFGDSAVTGEAVGDSAVTVSAKARWEAFDESHINGLSDYRGKKSAVPVGERNGGSPFGDSFVFPTSTPTPVNGKPQDDQSLI